MDLILFLLLAGAAGGYILYLRIRLYVNQRILKAFQQSAIIVPPARPKTDVHIGFMATAVLLLVLAVLALGVAR